MDTVLETPSILATISSGFVTKEETSIVMQCHDRIFKKVTVLDEADEILFTGESKGMASLSWRRSLKDASGNPIFDLSRNIAYPVKNQWEIQTPTVRDICIVKHSSLRTRQALNAVVKLEKDKGNEVQLELQPQDQGALASLLLIRGVPVAEIQMTGVNTSNFHSGDRSVWKARVAAGVDLALVVAIMLCRAELQHAWRE